MSHSVESSPLGQKTLYASAYDPALLFPISRAESRAVLGVTAKLPFFGCDIWTGYEISWLNEKGKPEVAVAEFVIPCDSPFIIESKSFKLYLNSFNQTRFPNFSAVEATLLKDLSATAGAQVSLKLQSLENSTLSIATTAEGICLDAADVDVDIYHPHPAFLDADPSNIVDELLFSNLLKSNCPVTGQPDWASVFIKYKGPKLDRENLLRYIISFREHQDFHEHCVERMFIDISSHCRPEELSVYARYTRRGGLDINPFRSSKNDVKPNEGQLKVGRLKVGRLVRQ